MGCALEEASSSPNEGSRLSHFFWLPRAGCIQLEFGLSRATTFAESIPPVQCAESKIIDIYLKYLHGALNYLQDLNSKRIGAGRILSSQKLTICRHEDLRSPRLRGLLIDAVACSVQSFLQMKRHVLLSIDIDFLLITEPCDSLASDQQRTVGQGDFQKRGGAVAQCGNHCRCVVEFANKLDGDGVVDKIEHC